MSLCLTQLPDFGMAKFLKNEKDIAAELAHALGVVVKARGMTDIVRSTGITREALYKALRPNAKPRFEIIHKVCVALGVKLVAQPVQNH